MEGMQAEEGLLTFRILALGCFPKERLSLISDLCDGEVVLKNEKNLQFK